MAASVASFEPVRGQATSTSKAGGDRRGRATPHNAWRAHRDRGGAVIAALTLARRSGYAVTRSPDAADRSMAAMTSWRRRQCRRTGHRVTLTDAGVARLTETAPIHAHGIAEYFMSRLDDQELAVLESALDKVTVDCTFG